MAKVLVRAITVGVLGVVLGLLGSASFVASGGQNPPGSPGRGAG